MLPLGEKVIIMHICSWKISFFCSYGTDTCETFSSEKEPPLSPWEKWLIQKAKEDRIKQREKHAAIKKKKIEEDEKKRTEEEKLKKAEIQRNGWVEKKDMEDRIKMKLEKQNEKTEQELKAEEKRHIEEKAKQRLVHISLHGVMRYGVHYRLLSVACPGIDTRVQGTTVFSLI
jgi:hypothetical protein